MVGLVCHCTRFSALQVRGERGNSALALSVKPKATRVHPPRGHRSLRSSCLGGPTPLRGGWVFGASIRFPRAPAFSQEESLHGEFLFLSRLNFVLPPSEEIDAACACLLRWDLRFRQLILRCHPGEQRRWFLSGTARSIDAGGLRAQQLATPANFFRDSSQHATCLLRSKSNFDVRVEAASPLDIGLSRKSILRCARKVSPKCSERALQRSKVHFTRVPVC
jgi:hypothetical protein